MFVLGISFFPTRRGPLLKLAPNFDARLFVPLS
jgi:hypothetical protein